MTLIYLLIGLEVLTVLFIAVFLIRKIRKMIRGKKDMKRGDS